MQSDGIRTVMDFVFNHSATNFAPFADVVKNGPNSNYKDWYLVKSFPVRVGDPPNYIAWNGYAAMPKLNLTNPATADYMPRFGGLLEARSAAIGHSPGRG